MKLRPLAAFAMTTMGLPGVIGVLATIIITSTLGAQQTWNDPRTRELVEHATARRASQIADTALADYKATAHGYVTFLAQFGEGFPEFSIAETVSKMGLEVSGSAPDLSKT